MAVHGVSRATLDLDLLAMDQTLLDGARWEELVREGVSVDLRRGDSDDPLAGVVRLRAADERDVDIVVGRSAWQHGVIERAELYSIGDLVLPVVRVADLIVLKLFAGGTQDSWDIEQLLAAGDRDALASEVERSLEDLPPDSADLWRKIRVG
jgi:hypothetical protein